MRFVTWPPKPKEKTQETAWSIMDSQKVCLLLPSLYESDIPLCTPTDVNVTVTLLPDFFKDQLHVANVLTVYTGGDLWTMLQSWPYVTQLPKVSIWQLETTI